jgi:hypothetical protein
MTKTALYRHFNANGALLYVGISLNAVSRQFQHKHKSHWYYDIARIELQWFDTKHEAERAEWMAIHNENPLHNKTFRNKPYVPIEDRISVPGVAVEPPIPRQPSTKEQLATIRARNIEHRKDMVRRRDR